MAMDRRVIAGTIFGLLCLMQGSRGQYAPAASAQRKFVQQTLAPAGPFRVEGNQIFDSKGRPFLIRGTQLTEFHLETAARDNSAGVYYGSHSATTLSAIRLRFNLNAVRLPVEVLDGAKPGYFPALAKVVRRANQMDMLVILAAREPGAGLPTHETVEFWSRCATYFKDYPNVMFDVFDGPSPSAVPAGVTEAHSALGWEVWRQGMETLVHAIRSAGATQPLMVMGWNDGRMFEGATAAMDDDANIVYEASPHYSSTRDDADRDAHFGFLARSVPVLASGWDPELDNAPDCAAIPSDPAAASALIESNLNYFDAHGISWTASVFEPGKLIKDLSLHDATSLENGWTCGIPDPNPAGMGRVIQAHMRASVERELFVVSGAGGVVIARGAFALAYGPIMAERDSKSFGPRPPISLGGIHVQVTDVLGVTRPAGIFWASEGWGQTNFVIPDQSAPGPARMTIVRDDGSSTSTNISIADTAPGFVTGHSCRGPAIGSATLTWADGHASTSQLSWCKGFDCKTIAVPVAVGGVTRVSISGSGFRHASSAAAIEMRIGGVRVPVVSFGPTGGSGEDQVTVEIPARLYGIGETDLVCHLNGRISNATRIRIGTAKPIS
jgi:uncharacterized protein (TIGR03437 family)